VSPIPCLMRQFGGSRAAEEAYRYLSDLQMLGRWALGCFSTHATARGGLFKGTSLFDGQEVWVRIETDPNRSD